MTRWLAVVCFVLAGCEADPDDPAFQAAAQQGVQKTPQPGANPFAPQTGSDGFQPQVATSDPFQTAPSDDLQPDWQLTDPFLPGSRGEEDEQEQFLPGLAGLTFYGCSCLTPGDIVASVWFWACASNPFEAALMSWKKLPCIQSGYCTSCVCYPGATCFLKG